MNSSNVTLVTVTYGDRIKYLAELLKRSLGDQGVEYAIVVNNGSTADFKPLIRQWGQRLTLLNCATNSGSAHGYAIGIDEALRSDAQTLWLMDDDNAPADGSIPTLKRELAKLSDEVGRDRAAVIGFRETMTDILRHPERAFPPHSNFIGFHIHQLPDKIFRHMGFKRQASAHPSPRAPVEVPYVPYGGFMAHRDVFVRLGSPKKDLVLYIDDWEYTFRLTKSAGSIRIVPDARLDDLEPSWHQDKKPSNAFITLLRNGEDFRAYYAFRNQTWFNRHIMMENRTTYEINKFVFLSILLAVAIVTGTRRRFSLICRAIQDGENNRLGPNPAFPLP